MEVYIDANCHICIPIVLFELSESTNGSLIRPRVHPWCSILAVYTVVIPQSFIIYSHQLK